MSGTIKPQPPPDEPSTRAAPEGFHFEWTADACWGLATDEDAHARHCRRPGCQRKPVAYLRRASRVSKEGVRYFYCDWHMYGREIHDGTVVFHRLVADSAGAQKDR